jgi:hypothetical protein
MCVGPLFAERCEGQRWRWRYVVWLCLDVQDTLGMRAVGGVA